MLADVGSITTVGLDGDDTLWDSESHFVLTTKRFADLLEPWLPSLDAVEERLLEVEAHNLALLGYGVKAFTLSMIETAIEVSEGTVPAGHIREILGWGKELLDHPVELLDGVAETVDAPGRPVPPAPRDQGRPLPPGVEGRPVGARGGVRRDRHREREGPRDLPAGAGPPRGVAPGSS